MTNLTATEAQAELDRRAANRAAKKAGTKNYAKAASAAAFSATKSDLVAILAADAPAETGSTDFATMTPAEVDTLWNEATESLRKYFRYLAEFVANDGEASYKRSGTVYGFDYVEALRRAEAGEMGVDRHGRVTFPGDRHAASVAEYAEAMREAIANRDACAAEFDRRGGWSRAYLVVSSKNGHVHRNWCGSWRWTTLVAIVTDLSGKGEDAIVEYAGEQACSRCFKSAPLSL